MTFQQEKTLKKQFNLDFAVELVNKMAFFNPLLHCV